MKPLDPLPSSALEDLPLFPLPGTVWFPGTPLALHVFEPRYRALARDVLAGDRAFAVPLLRPGYEADYEAAPPIRAIAGAGRIVEEQGLPGGRWNLLLVGLCRVRLHEQPASRAYRTARAEPIDDRYPAGGPESLRSEIATLLSAVSPIVAHVRKSDERFSLGVEPGMPPGRVADVVAHRLVTEPEARQRILEAIEVGERLALVTRAISDRLATLPGIGTLQ
jgi:Lon protease-like protein